MKRLASYAFSLIATLWMFWGATLAGFTMFAYLGGVRQWDTHLAYAMGLFALIPVFGGLAAAFVSEPVQGWNFFHAAFNFTGFLIPALIAGALKHWDEKNRDEGLPHGERMIRRYMRSRDP